MREKSLSILENLPPAQNIAIIAACPTGADPVISHGITARVLRGLLVGGDDWHGVKVAGNAPQGTVFRIQDGAEEAVHVGSGVAGVKAA